MSQYIDGTVTTDGTTTVVGAGTSWTTEVVAGDLFMIPVANGGDGLPYTVASTPVSDTALVLTGAYAGANVSGVNYAITRDFTANQSLPLINRNDVPTATIFSRAIALIDSALAGFTSGILGVLFGGTGSSTASGARTNLSAALSSNPTGDLPILDGGTGSSTASAARTALGIAIGSDVQAWSSTLDEAAIGPTITVDKSLWPTIANGIDTDHDIDISAGSMADSTGLFLLTNAALTKQIDAAWAVGTNQGGLFSGTVAADTTYHVFIIRKDADGSIDAGFDTSKSAANLPSGYTAFRRLGSVLTDASSNILAFTNHGDFFELLTPILELNSPTGSVGSGALLTLSVPADTYAQIMVSLASVSSTQAWAQGAGVTDSAPSLTNRDLATSSGATQQSIIKVIPTNGSSQIRYRNDSISSGAIGINTKGWWDYRND